MNFFCLTFFAQHYVYENCLCVLSVEIASSFGFLCTIPLYKNMIKRKDNIVHDRIHCSLPFSEMRQLNSEKGALSHQKSWEEFVVELIPTWFCGFSLLSVLILLQTHKQVSCIP